IQIKPRNPSNTSITCVCKALEQFDIEVSKIHVSQDGQYYNVEVTCGSWGKIQSQIKGLRLRLWEFKLVKAAFKDGKLPSVSDLKEQFLQVASKATPSMSGYNYAFTINKVDFCSLYCFQTTQPSPQSDGSLWKHLVKVEVECLSSYCHLDGKSFYYDFLTSIVSDDCWICWKFNGATSDGIILGSNLKKIKKV
uniref:Uncharacterized protein n=1 Tax=Amphimedon queenslandica TaxID=400682 RepID=A0A1X7TS38_AMPQE